jgi:hypothetical protein
MPKDILMFETSPCREVNTRDANLGPEVVDRMAPWHVSIRKIPADILCENLGSFIEEIGAILHKVPEIARPWGLDTLEISATVNAEGQIGLLGTGGKIAGGSEIRLIFKKNPRKETEST